MRDVDNGADVLDSRDVEARIDEMQAEADALVEAVEEAVNDLNEYDEDHEHDENDSARDELVDILALARKELADYLASDEPAELASLKAFRDEFANYCDDWTHGVTLVRDSYFKEYARELADDIGAINSDASWPNDCIDWDKAARELQMAYTSGEFDGITYWAR